MLGKFPSDFSGTLPWTKSCFVCGQDNPRGFRLRSRVEGDRVVLTYTTQPSDVGYRHLVHGGIIMTLMDEVMTWTAILATGRICVAAEMTTRLKHAIAVGQTLRVEARLTEHKKRLLLTEAAVTHTDGKVVAEATGKYVPVPAEKAPLAEEDFIHSPEAIDPHTIVGS